MSTTHCLASGHTIQHYRIDRVLGEGGFGLTYLATDIHLRKQVVIKENFPASLAARQEDGSVKPPPGEEEIFQLLLNNFLKEARILASFEHPAIVSLYSYFEDHGTAYFVMPFIEGISLATFVEQRGEEGLSLPEYVSMLEPLLDALDVLHRGKVGRGSTTDAQLSIYHRDIKPDNILIAKEGDETWTPVLIDFGSARDINTYRNTKAFANTIRFKSGAFTPPEFSENDLRVIGPSSDLFGLGATLYACLTGDTMHDRSQIVDLTENPDMVATYGEVFLQLIMDAIELSAKDRPQTSDEWRERLEQARREKAPEAAAIRVQKTATADAHQEDGVTGKNNSIKLSAASKRRAIASGIMATLLILVALVYYPNRGAAPTPVPAIVSSNNLPTKASKPEQEALEEIVEGHQPGEVRTFSGILFQWCPPGSFDRGTPETESERYRDESPQHVTLTKGFWLAKYECTQAQWAAVVESNPSHIFGAQKPVDSVSWIDAQQYLGRLNRSAPPPEQWTYRLPTEAEWEYACRAETHTVFSFGNTLNGHQANCKGSVPYQTSQPGPFMNTTANVGSYSPNAWGLHDMHGNVEEFCHDWYGAYDLTQPVDPTGPATGTDRVGRGGFWGQPGEGCRAGKRGRYNPSFSHSGAGFRIALVWDGDGS